MSTVSYVTIFNLKSSIFNKLTITFLFINLKGLTMTKKYKWSYSSTPGHNCGTMICTACHKKVILGEFRYRETSDAYLVQHRACSKDDPHWIKLDEEKNQRYESIKVRLDAFIEFKKQWNVEIEEFNEEIESMLAIVDNHKNCKK